MHKALLLAIIGCAALVVPATSAVAQAGSSRRPASETIAELHGRTPVRAYHDVQAWTDYDAADKRWHVVVRGRGVISVPAAIPAGDERLAVDVGPGPDGSPVLAYVRCRDACRVVVSAIDGSGATTMRGSAGASSPTIWRSRVAWVRGGQTVMSRRIGRGAASSIAGVPRRKCYEPPSGNRRCEHPSDPRVDELELRGSSLALVVRYWLTQGGGNNGVTEVRTQSVGGRRQRLVALLNIGEGFQHWAGPSWAKGDLFFYMSCPFACGKAEGAYRFDPRRGAYSHAAIPTAAAGFAMDDDGRRAFRTDGGAAAFGSRTDSAGWPGSLQLIGPLRFTGAHRPQSTL